MNKWLSVFQSLIGTEAQIIPFFIHNQQSQQIAAVVLVSEEAVAGILAGLQPPAPAATSSYIPPPK